MDFAIQKAPSAPDRLNFCFIKTQADLTNSLQFQFQQWQSKLACLRPIE